MREVRPQVLVTYDENGGYGHPDHIQAHRVAMAAVDAAADPALRAGDRRAVGGGQGLLDGGAPLGSSSAASSCCSSRGRATSSASTGPTTCPSWCRTRLVTTAVDGGAHLAAKLAAMRAHASQIAADGPFFTLAEKVGEQAFGTEYFRLVRGRPGPADGPDGRETDLFAGLV